MAVRMSGFTFSRVAEVSGNFRIAFNVSNFSEIQVPPVGHGFASECIFQVLLGLAAFKIGHIYSPCEMTRRLLN
jgi:hypothetical protein